MHKKKYVFLSYSRKDYDFAMQLKDDLQELGFDVWVDQKKISGGEVWRKSIADALADSHTVVWVVSPDSVDSRYVNKELSFADGRDVRIIPVMYKKAEIPFPYHELQFVDVSKVYDNESLDEIVESINTFETKKTKHRKGIFKNSFLSIVNGLEKLVYTAIVIFVVGGGFYFWHLNSKNSAEVPKIKDKIIEKTKIVNNTDKLSVESPIKTKTKPVVIPEPKEDIKEIQKIEVKKTTIPIKVTEKKHISKINWKQISKEKLSQRDAIYTCKKSGLRLATVGELKALADDKKIAQKIEDTNAFPYDFWSSTVSKKDKTKAYVFRFNDKSKNRIDINERFNFLCIKKND